MTRFKIKKYTKWCFITAFVAAVLSIPNSLAFSSEEKTSALLNQNFDQSNRTIVMPSRLPDYSTLSPNYSVLKQHIQNSRNKRTVIAIENTIFDSFPYLSSKTAIYIGSDYRLAVFDPRTQFFLAEGEKFFDFTNKDITCSQWTLISNFRDKIMTSNRKDMSQNISPERLVFFDQLETKSALKKVKNYQLNLQYEKQFKSTDSSQGAAIATVQIFRPIDVSIRYAEIYNRNTSVVPNRRLNPRRSLMFQTTLNSFLPKKVKLPATAKLIGNYTHNSYSSSISQIGIRVSKDINHKNSPYSVGVEVAQFVAIESNWATNPTLSLYFKEGNNPYLKITCDSSKKVSFKIDFIKLGQIATELCKQQN